jgi:hypothetical protein
VDGPPEWPTGSVKVTVRLFTAGRDIVVEQQFHLAPDEQNGLLLDYARDSTLEENRP